MLDERSDEQRIILVSCMYFRGLWTIPFEEHSTKERIVHAPSGDVRRPFMHLEDHLDYFEDRNIQATRLSYGSSGGLRINVYGNFLPSRQLVRPARVLRRLQPSLWHSLRNAAELRPRTLALPCLRTERSIQLNETLQAAGIARAIDPKESDFRGMICEPDPGGSEQCIRIRF